MEEKRSRLQEKEFLRLKNENRVILKWATGCGKSKMAIDLINHTVSTACKLVKVLFVVAERAHINNWQDEFEKWHLRFDKVATDVICYASLKKYAYSNYDIIVFDEAHHMFSEKRLNIINTITSKYVYLLSATLPSSKIDIIEDIYGKFTISSVTLKDAIDSDILPDPRIFVIKMSLDNTIPNQEIKVGLGDNLPVVKWEDRGKYIYKSIPCIIRCTQFQKYLYLTDTMEYWKRRYTSSHNQFHHNKWVNTGSVRKRFMGELKTEAVYRFIQTLSKNKRFVCFCSTVNQAIMLSSKYTISSKQSTQKNQFIINAFNVGRINNLYAVGMITEGMNLNGIQLGIIVQLDGKERLFIQKFGRSMRAQDPVSVIFYYENTQDEIYLKNALEKIDDKYISRVNLDNINSIKL